MAANYTVSVIASATGANNSQSANASLTVQPASSARGCEDDLSVPIVRNIDFSVSPPFVTGSQLFSTAGEGFTQPPSVVALKLNVVARGGYWQGGGLQVGPINGTSLSEAVFSRCRGHFGGDNPLPGTNGLVHVVRLDNYAGRENQSSATFFPMWEVDAARPYDIYTAQLNAPGNLSRKDGVISNGVYYINIRQRYCNNTFGAFCERSLGGSGYFIQ